ncbi:MAG: hypothetical protein ACOWWM_12360 [Desulfobacterales bacterium]
MSLPLYRAMVFFEGTEKKLEIIFNGPIAGFRRQPDWDRIVQESGAAVLNRISSEEMDAYLLSESSLFVWSDRLLLITCGRTTPVSVVPLVLEAAGQDRLSRVFFERKNPQLPMAQPTGFDDDVARLQAYFNGKSTRLGSPHRDHIHLFWTPEEAPLRDPDITFQVLMHDLDPSIAEFFFSGTASTSRSSVLGRLRKLHPFQVIDEYFFSPQGYSLNAIDGGLYFTVHITPQASGSYASYESNAPRVDFDRIMSELQAIFRPYRFSSMLTTNSAGGAEKLHERLAAVSALLPLEESVHAVLDAHYRTTFMNFRG